MEPSQVTNDLSINLQGNWDDGEPEYDVSRSVGLKYMAIVMCRDEFQDARVPFSFSPSAHHLAQNYCFRKEKESRPVKGGTWRVKIEKQEKQGCVIAVSV